MADKDKVIGKALYLEFRSGAHTYQTIITPDGVSSEGRQVPSTMYRRQISRMKPRRAWKAYALPNLPQDAIGGFKKLEVADAVDQAKSRANFLENIVTRLDGAAYRLYKSPIVVEVSQADLDEVRHHKTPYKILGRITRLRRQLGFGEDLFA